MPRHKHADVIHAWADGAEIQYRRYKEEQWVDVDSTCFNPGFEYRIKPRILKHEGWVNIYRLPGGEFPSAVCCVHHTEEAAKTCAGIGTVARVKVEWEEEEGLFSVH